MSEVRRRVSFSRLTDSQVFLPTLTLLLILLFDFIFIPGFFNLEMKDGHLYGSLVDILRNSAPTVILARWLATEPRLLILDEPTRGIDVGTKADIQKLVLSLAEQGMSCMFISSELDEVLRTSHRIVVLRDRVKGAEFSGEVDEKAIMEAIAGGTV